MIFITVYPEERLAGEVRSSFTRYCRVALYHQETFANLILHMEAVKLDQGWQGVILYPWVMCPTACNVTILTDFFLATNCNNVPEKRKRKQKQKQPSCNFCLSSRLNWVLDLAAPRSLLWCKNRAVQLVFFGPHFANLRVAAPLWPDDMLSSWKVMHCIVEEEKLFIIWSCCLSVQMSKKFSRSCLDTLPREKKMKQRQLHILVFKIDKKNLFFCILDFFCIL